MDEFVTVARIVKTHAIRGEVKADLLTDFPDRFSRLRKVRISKSGKTTWEELVQCRLHHGRVIMKFLGRDCPEEVEDLIGGDVQIPASERVPLPEDSYYHSDLVGCEVLESGTVRGTVTGVLETGPAGANLVVIAPSGEEFMIPLVREFIIRIDIKEKSIEVKLPSGLLPD